MRNCRNFTFELSTGLFLLVFFLAFHPQIAFSQDANAQTSDQSLDSKMDNPQPEAELRDDLKMRLNNAEYKIKRLTDQLESIRNKMDRLESKIERLQRLENINSRIDSLDRRIDSVESLASRIERNQN